MRINKYVENEKLTQKVVRDIYIYIRVYYNIFVYIYVLRSLSYHIYCRECSV